MVCDVTVLFLYLLFAFYEAGIQLFCNLSFIPNTHIIKNGKIKIILMLLKMIFRIPFQRAFKANL